MNLPGHEEAAQEILRRSGSETPPVNLSQIASLFDGLTVKEVELDAEGYLVDASPLGAVILVNQSSRPSRKRYTVAHEIGHLYLTRCGVRPPSHIAEHVAVERWCDSFAAALLMPADMVQQTIRQFDSWDEVLRYGPGMLSVSKEALTNRITQVRDIAFFYIDTKTWTVVTSYVGKRRLAVDLDKEVQRAIRLIRAGQLKSDYFDEHCSLWIRHTRFRAGSGMRILLTVEAPPER